MEFILKIAVTVLAKIDYKLNYTLLYFEMSNDCLHSSKIVLFVVAQKYTYVSAYTNERTVIKKQFTAFSRYRTCITQPTDLQI